MHDGREVVGAGMRTAPFSPRPVFLLSMPQEAARLLARTLYERQEPMGGVNGALPAVRVCAEESARLIGGVVEVAMHTRLFELGEVISLARPEGRLRPATAKDCELAVAWFAAFMADADQEAGRSPGSSPHDVPDRDAMMMRIEDGRLWFWEDDAGHPVHLTAVNPVVHDGSRSIERGRVVLGYCGEVCGNVETESELIPGIGAAHAERPTRSRSKTASISAPVKR